jgi:4-alpha-glucanotransferase
MRLPDSSTSRVMRALNSAPMPWYSTRQGRAHFSTSDTPDGNGPGAGFFEAVHQELGRLPFIAEDLGIITKDVEILRDEFQLLGTRVLQFAFDGHSDNPYLPHNFSSNTVAYTGTH